MLTAGADVPRPLFELRTSACGTTLTIACTGELDLAVGDDLRAAVDRAIEAAPERLVIDLSGLEFVDSTGIHALLRAYRRAQARGVRLVVIRARDHVHRVFQVCRLDRMLPFASD